MRGGEARAERNSRSGGTRSQRVLERMLSRERNSSWSVRLHFTSPRAPRAWWLETKSHAPRRSFGKTIFWGLGRILHLLRFLFGGNLGRASRVPHFCFKKIDEFCSGVSIVPSSHLFPKSLNESPHHRSLRSHVPQKMFFTFLILRATDFF